jgi:hypothetical protein
MLLPGRKISAKISGHASGVLAYFFPRRIVLNFTNLMSLNPDFLNKE